MYVLPYYRQISLGKKFDRRSTRLVRCLALQNFVRFEAENANFSVLIAHANRVPIAQSAKYGSAKCKWVIQSAK